MNRMMGLGLFLLGLAVGLLWCGTGLHAEGMTSLDYPYIRDVVSAGQHRPEVSFDGMVWEPLPCLAKMEQAMRMWDIYINQLNHDKPITHIPGDQSLYDVWTDAKHCWRTP